MRPSLLHRGQERPRGGRPRCVRGVILLPILALRRVHRRGNTEADPGEKAINVEDPVSYSIITCWLYTGSSKTIIITVNL